jgi:hypothetical protein
VQGSTPCTPFGDYTVPAVVVVERRRRDHCVDRRKMTIVQYIPKESSLAFWQGLGAGGLGLAWQSRRLTVQVVDRILECAAGVCACPRSEMSESERRP